MITTKQQLREQKAAGFYVKEDNPARKHMSYAEAKADSLADIEEREKVADYKRKLKSEREQKISDAKADGDKVKDDGDGSADDVDTSSAPQLSEKEKTDQAEAGEKETKIVALEDKFTKQKGPGSKKRRDEIREQINALKG